MTAARRGRADCVTYLISRHADVNAAERNGKSVLMIAKGHPDVIAILKAAGAK